MMTFRVAVPTKLAVTVVGPVIGTAQVSDRPQAGALQPPNVTANLTSRDCHR
jgi:hypothetical protein